MKYHILASGSKGNAAFIYENNTGVLIDCGITRKQLLFKLDEFSSFETITMFFRLISFL